MADDHDGAQEAIIEPGLCLALLDSQQLGRCVTGGTNPRIRPVNYVFDGAIFFRTDRPPTSGSEVLFEVDQFDEARREGWSVIIEGHVFVAALDDLSAESFARLHPWAPGQKSSLCKIVIDTMSGRWVRAERQAAIGDDRGYL